MGKKITIREASERLGVHRQTVRELITRGDIRGYQLGTTRNIRVDADDIDKLYRPLPTGGRKSGAA